MPELTEAHKKELLKDPNHCPYCGSTDIQSGDRNSDDNWISQDVSCNDCELEWEEIYTLSSIEEK